MEPKIGLTYRSTKTEQPEAVTIIWVTADGGAVMVGHEGGMMPLKRSQWDDWCERVGAEEWTDNPPHLTHEISGADLASLSSLDSLDKVFNSE